VVSDELIWVRATVHLPGLPLGAVVQVDPSRPYIKDALEYGRLVRESEPDGTPAEDGDDVAVAAT
jgi:hypothetical protein